ncbi:MULTISPECIES: DUF421 domain-containing protein [unclassified Virgibacillus]|uniref:DUF421 domain-containing protein n=1 Tax=unclassified Virgibacillus TaxID=2620237 RepID=UPI0024DE06CC|nr:DUF421 domain-containing protein [Virgibacillus sp. LDC-1]
MDFDWIWKAIVIVFAGTFLLRLAGRKSISQMTLPQTVIMVGIGSLLIQPVAGKNIWITVGVGGILVLTLIAMELAQIKGNVFEKLLTGKSKILIEDGRLNEKNLRKVRLTVDQLEMNLRQNQVTNMNDVQWATLEPNGQLGFTLKSEAQPVTKKEFQQAMMRIEQTLNKRLENHHYAELHAQLSQLNQHFQQMNQQASLFTEVEQNENFPPPPKHLQ